MRACVGVYGFGEELSISRNANVTATRKVN